MMPRGHAQIVAAADSSLGTLLAITDSHPAVSLGAAYVRRTTTDLLAHLHAWHTLCEGWIAADRTGDTVAYPAEGYTWRDLDALNESLYAAHAGGDYDAARNALVASHGRVCAIVLSTPEIDLITPQGKTWLGDQSLGDVLHDCLGAHYEWAVGILHAAGCGEDS